MPELKIVVHHVLFRMHLPEQNLWSFSVNSPSLYKQGIVGKLLQKNSIRKFVILIALAFEPLSQSLHIIKSLMFS